MILPAHHNLPLHNLQGRMENLQICHSSPKNIMRKTVHAFSGTIQGIENKRNIIFMNN